MIAPQQRLRRARRELNTWMLKNYEVLYVLSSETRKGMLWVHKPKEYMRLIRRRGYFDIRVERILQAQREIAQQPKPKRKSK